MELTKVKKFANDIRKGVIISTYNAKSGHPGGSLSCADILAYLYAEKLNIDPKNPKWEDRDRFVLSKGHCAPALYSALALKGYFDFSDLKTLRKPDSYLQGHPDMKHIPGVDMSSGSLGQGISAACGMALSAKLDKKNYKVYTLLGDGEISEGQVWEALMFAAHKKLTNLCVIIDNNNLQIDGELTEVNSPYPIDEKLKAFGFDTYVIDGHNFDEIEDVFNKFTNNNDKPTAVIAKTIKGKGVSYMENVCDWHGAAPNCEQYNIAMAELERNE